MKKVDVSRVTTIQSDVQLPAQVHCLTPNSTVDGIPPSEEIVSSIVFDAKGKLLPFVRVQASVQSVFNQIDISSLERMVGKTVVVKLFLETEKKMVTKRGLLLSVSETALTLARYKKENGTLLYTHSKPKGGVEEGNDEVQVFMMRRVVSVVLAQKSQGLQTKELVHDNGQACHGPLQLSYFLHPGLLTWSPKYTFFLNEDLTKIEHVRAIASIYNTSPYAKCLGQGLELVATRQMASAALVSAQSSYMDNAESYSIKESKKMSFLSPSSSSSSSSYSDYNQPMSSNPDLFTKKWQMDLTEQTSLLAPKHRMEIPLFLQKDLYCNSWFTIREAFIVQKDVSDKKNKTPQQFTIRLWNRKHKDSYAKLDPWLFGAVKDDEEEDDEKKPKHEIEVWPKGADLQLVKVQKCNKSGSLQSPVHIELLHKQNWSSHVGVGQHMDLELTPPWTFSYSVNHVYLEASVPPVSLTAQEKTELEEKYRNTYNNYSVHNLFKQKHISTITLTLHNKQDKPLTHMVYVNLQPPHYVDRMIGEFKTSYHLQSKTGGVKVSVSPQNQFTFFVQHIPANSHTVVKFDLEFYIVVRIKGENK